MRLIAHACLLLLCLNTANAKDESITLDLRSRAAKDYAMYQASLGQDGFYSKVGSRTPYYSKQTYQKLINKFRASKKAQPKEYFIPLGLSKTELITALATASVGLVVFNSDEELMEHVQQNKTDTTRKIEDFGYIAGGDGLKYFVAGTYLMGVVLKNGKIKQVGILSASSAMAALVVTEAFKVGFGRQRPREDRGAYEFRTSGKSFFSGHASATMAVATVFAEIYKESWAGAPYLAYGVAGLVAYARVHERGHWGSDVIFGALAGYLSAKLVMRVFKKDDSYGGFLVAPAWDPTTGTASIQFTYMAESKKTKFNCSEFDAYDKRTRLRLCLEKSFFINNH